jgi:hypothetical protein
MRSDTNFETRSHRHLVAAGIHGAAGEFRLMIKQVNSGPLTVGSGPV